MFMIKGCSPCSCRGKSIHKGTVILFLAGENLSILYLPEKSWSHYGKYSYLLFVKGENMEKGIWEAEKLRRDFHENN